MSKRIDSPRPPPPHILRQINEHQRWLESGGKEGTRIGSGEKAIHFHGLALDGIDLSLGELDCSEFTGSSLRQAWLIGTHLDGVYFKDSDLTGACLDGADLTAANFIGVAYSQATFKGANTKDTIWTRADAESFEKKYKSRFKEIFEARKGWTDADWEAYYNECDEKASAAEGRLEAMTQEGFEIWRRKKSEAVGPQPA